MFDCEVILVDPTPRAVLHFEAVVNNLGNNRNREYVLGGQQPIDAYDLRRVSSAQIQLIPVAISGEDGHVTFFAPTDPRNVSHSINNFQNRYRHDTPNISVPSLKYSSLVAERQIAPLLVKLDIEGAEGEVIFDILRSGPLPQQILVEYDELQVPSLAHRNKIKAIHRALRQSGYVLVAIEKPHNFTYFLTEPAAEQGH